ncbi:Nn.00g054470.m01.CDS01 [Neocucurbitaria sp. VM-36]
MPGLDQIIPRPDSRELLPPLLACLSTASTSREPPPGLLPLLSPILRQRVQLLSSGEWLSLLCWDREIGSRLPQVIEKIYVEPHPASGEIEVEEPDQILFRRSDHETLHSRLVLSEFGLVPTYLWCTGGDGGSRWLLAELRGVEDTDDGTQWFESMAEANEAGYQRKTVKSNGVTAQHASLQPEPTKEDEDEDDSYWAAYDRTPGRTPQHKRSPAPVTNSRTQVGPTQSELEYFARYASEVQPALDAHDPDEEIPGPGESTLNGNALNYTREIQTEPLETTNLGADGYDSSMPPAYTVGTTNGNGLTEHDNPEHIEATEESPGATLNHPRPSSSASTNSVDRLERQAENYSQAELAIKQHISTDIKSLFRLARASGIDREEFERIIQRELEVLPMLEQEMN